MIKIGYWLSEKKIKKLNFNEFTDTCKNAGLTLVKIDLDQSLEEQGPFALIIHKINDVLVTAEYGDPLAKERQERFMAYLKGHPETVILDPLENINSLKNRHEQYTLVKECCQNNINDNYDMFIPAFVKLTNSNFEENKRIVSKHNLQYPLVCKHTCSQGAPASHEMYLVFNEEGLRDLTPPCVVQTFINHNAKLYKIFMVGDRFSIIDRPSIKNLCAGPTKTIFFDSSQVSKLHSQSFLNQVIEDELELPIFKPDYNKLKKFSVALRRKIGLSLMGIDVIIENCTGKYGIVDLNTFPGYDGVPDFFQSLLDLLIEKLPASAHQELNGVSRALISKHMCLSEKHRLNNNCLREQQPQLQESHFNSTGQQQNGIISSIKSSQFQNDVSV